MPGYDSIASTTNVNIPPTPNRDFGMPTASDAHTVINVIPGEANEVDDSAFPNADTPLLRSATGVRNSCCSALSSRVRSCVARGCMLALAPAIFISTIGAITHSGMYAMHNTHPGHAAANTGLATSLGAIGFSACVAALRRGTSGPTTAYYLQEIPVSAAAILGALIGMDAATLPYLVAGAHADGPSC